MIYKADTAIPLSRNSRACQAFFLKKMGFISQGCDRLEQLSRGLKRPLEHPPETAAHRLRRQHCHRGVIQGAGDAEGYGDEGAAFPGNDPSHNGYMAQDGIHRLQRRQEQYDVCLSPGNIDPPLTYDLSAARRGRTTLTS